MRETGPARTTTRCCLELTKRRTRPARPAAQRPSLPAMWTCPSGAAAAAPRARAGRRARCRCDVRPSPRVPLVVPHGPPARTSSSARRRGASRRGRQARSIGLLSVHSGSTRTKRAVSGLPVFRELAASACFCGARRERACAAQTQSAAAQHHRRTRGCSDAVVVIVVGPASVAQSPQRGRCSFWPGFAENWAV